MAVKLPMAACVVLCAVASAQAVHHGSIWLQGPDEVLAPNSTYTIEAWAQWESPSFIQDTSAIAGFGFDVINTIGSGDQVASVGNVEFHQWCVDWSNVGAIVGTDILAISGGQIPNPGIVPIWPLVDLRNPIPLFTFEFTTAEALIGHIAFSPANASSYGGLSFYPDWHDGAMIIAPNDADTSLTLTDWEYVVPAPGALSCVGISVLTLTRRRP